MADVVGLTGGGFVVTWYNDSVNSGDVHAQRAEVTVSTETLSSQWQPAIAALAGGGYVITWNSLSSSGSAGGSNYGVFGQRLDAASFPSSWPAGAGLQGEAPGCSALDHRRLWRQCGKEKERSEH